MARPIKYYNVLQKHTGKLMLGMSMHSKRKAQWFVDHYYSNEYINRLNIARKQHSNASPLPLNDYEVVEIDKLWTV